MSKPLYSELKTNEIEETDNNLILTDYDDNVVCFGVVKLCQTQKLQRLLRHTILPSNIQSILKLMINSRNIDEDETASYIDVEEAKLSTILSTMK